MFLRVPYRLCYLLVFCFLVIFNACNPSTSTKDSYYNYGTKNDSARYYFLKGWEEILDNGRWTESESAYRKAVTLDPEWLLGKSLVGRISSDLTERQAILKDLLDGKGQASADERLLLDVNIASIEAAIGRAQGFKTTPAAAQYRRQLAETNFGKFARKHPEDAYFKAEYIEFLHANKGPQVALDSLRALATSSQRQLGFYRYYEASLELELGDYASADSIYLVLTEAMKDPTYTSPLMLKAQLLIAQDSMEQAQRVLNQVVRIDPKHLIAVGMKAQLDQALANMPIQ